MMTSAQVRQSFLDFFKSKEHTIVPSSSLMPDAPNLLFTNAGMNQFVPIFLGQQPCPYKPGRAADTQKCIRAGGKHNDLEDVGLDTYHHTLFEMLGNWSFGDYFKREAIDWAWELLVETWGFPKDRLYATYFGGDEQTPADAESRDLWLKHLPADHVVAGNRKDNFWMMGDTGPCGPCSEIHMDLTPKGDSRGKLVNVGSPLCIEIWNLVFIEFNAAADGSLTPLPSKHVDTGMGFERVTSFIQCTKNFKDFTGTISNYETDVFHPIFRRLEQLSGRRYASTLPAAGSGGANEQERTDVAFRVIADHVRCVAFAIADGIQPGNTDRNYVVRRILRRAVRYGRSLGFHKPFFHQLVDVVADTMGGVFPEIRANLDRVKDVIRLEEEAFNRTLDRGIELFREEIQRIGKSGDRAISGDFAFKLYDTYGFPLDLTQLMAREQKLSVDAEGFERLMDQQRARARAAQKKEAVEVSKLGVDEPTEFVGFETLESPARVLDVVNIKERVAVVLDRSACYAEMGGQVGDRGEIAEGGRLWRVVDTQKAAQTWLHFIEGSDAPDKGADVLLSVDTERRAAIQRHHTVTHIFHWALHEVVSRDASQKGSYVGPDKMTFDFNSAALTPAQIADVERLVNERILENSGVTWTEVPYADVKNRKDVMQFFGDKYGEIVRVVQIGGSPRALDGYSMELCGGTHTRATGEIGLFRIVSESAIAAGVRRVEAVAGLAAWKKVADDVHLLKAGAGALNCSPAEMEQRIAGLLAHQRELEKQLKSVHLAQAGDRAGDLAGRARTIGGIPAIIENLGDVDADTVVAVADQLKTRFQGVIVLGGGSGGAVSLLASVAPEFTAKVQAGKIIQAIAPIVGGKGGGRPEMARGGGKDPSKLDEALAKAATLLG